MSKISGNRRKKLLKWFRKQRVPNHKKRKHRECTLHNTRKVNPRDQAIFPLLSSGQFSPRILYKHVFPDLLEEVEKLLPKGYRMLPKSKDYLIVSTDPKKKRSWKWYDSSKFGDKMRRMRLDQPGPTVVAHLSKDGYMFVHPNENRTITVREAARMQSFPDSFDFSAGKTVAFSHQMRQIGNAVPPLLGVAIGQSILEYLNKKINLSVEGVFQEDFPNQAAGINAQSHRPKL
jgi:site-specific DNA-cytosine methylase